MPSPPPKRTAWVAMVVSMLILASVLPAAWAVTTAAPLDAEQYDLHFSKGILAFNRHQYDQAEQEFRSALEVNPGDAEASYYLGQSLVRQQKNDEAEQVFKSMLEADPQSGPALLGLGIVHYNRGRYQDALASLKAAEALLPDDPLVHYYEGLAYHKLQVYEQAEIAFGRAIAISPDLAPSAHYYSGVGYYRRGDFAKAKREFEEVVKAERESEFGRSAEQYLALASEAEPSPPQSPSRWSLTFSAGFEYDTNVVLLPNGVQPSVLGITDQRDSRAVLYAGGDFRPVQTETWLLGLGYGFYQSLQENLTRYNIQDNAPVAYVQRRFGNLWVGAQYGFNYTEVGTNPYLIMNTAQGWLTLAQSERTSTQVIFRYQYRNFRDSVSFPGNSVRDGINYMAGITQYLLFAQNKGNLRVGLAYDDNLTGAGDPQTTLNVPSDWAYQGFRGFVGVGFPLGWATTLDVGLDYYWQWYKNPNSLSFTLQKRQDEIFSASVLLTRPVFTDWLWLTLRYSYTNDDSNVQAYTYDRNIIHFSVTAQF